MPAMVYKHFMEEVKGRLARLSREELDNLVMSWADKTPASKRQQFLDEFVLPEASEAAAFSIEELLEEIEEFSARVQNGDYCEGWRWDDEIGDEREWGDESWADEMDEFFAHVRRLCLQGEHEPALEAYTQLFIILEMGQEPGHLPGNPDVRLMLKTDLEEQLALFLRCVYVNAAPPERPASVFEKIQFYGYLVESVNLRSLLNASDIPLPDFDEFLVGWIDFLTRKEEVGTSAWLREAVWLQGGIPAISAFARQHADQHPRAFMDWIEALYKGADDEAVIQAAKEGLDAIPRDYVARAEVADALVTIGKKRGDAALRLEGCYERFYSRPSVANVLALYEVALQGGSWDAFRRKAEQRVIELRESGGRYSGGYYDAEKRTASVSDGIAGNVLLLGGSYEQLLEICRHNGPLGWSSSNNPKPAVVAFLMAVLTKHGRHKETVMKQWEAAIRSTDTEMDERGVETYKRIALQAWEPFLLAAEQEAFYLKWCMDEIGLRVDAIVSKRYRTSYHKAAALVVTIGAVLASRGQEEEGTSFIEAYRSKYPRHTAFKSELDDAMDPFSF